jgi:hypothetical protein
MGDRCDFRMRCRPQDVDAIAEQLGAMADEAEGEPGECWIYDDQANYGHADAIEQLATVRGATFYGYHGAGCEYGPMVFAAHGGKLAHIESDWSGDSPVVHVGQDGEPAAWMLAEAREYFAILARAVEVLDAADRLAEAEGGAA